MKPAVVVAIVFLVTLLAGCTSDEPSTGGGDEPPEWNDWINRDSGGGGSGGGGSSEDREGGAPAVAGFGFTLEEGDWWEYRWSADYIRRYDGEITKSRGHVGTFAVELGSPVTVQGIQTFPLRVEGDYAFSAPEGTGVGWVFHPPWTHVALENHVFSGSRDGGPTLEPIFDAQTGTVHGDFFPSWNGTVRARAQQPIVQFSLENEFLAEPVLGREPFKYSSSSGDCYWDRNIAQEVCPAQAAGGNEDLHAWRPGVGPVGAYFMDSFAGELTNQYETWSIGLIGTSLKPQDGWEPELRSPWFRIANMPVQRDPDPAAVNVGDTFYVMGGDWDQSVIDPLDLSTGEWGEIVGRPGEFLESRAVPISNGFLLFDRAGDRIQVFEYREASKTWVERSPLALPFKAGSTAAIRLGDEVMFAGHQSDVDALRTYMYVVESDEWAALELDHPGHRFAKIALANVDSKLYLIGGSSSYTEPVKVLRMQPDEASWVHETDLPRATGTSWSAVGAGKAIVVLGPYGADRVTDVYDASTGTWHTFDPPPGVQYGTPALFTAWGHVLMIPGTSHWGAPLGVFAFPMADLPGNTSGDDG